MKHPFSFVFIALVITSFAWMGSDPSVESVILFLALGILTSVAITKVTPLLEGGVLSGQPKWPMAVWSFTVLLISSELVFQSAGDLGLFLVDKGQLAGFCIVYGGTGFLLGWANGLLANNARRTNGGSAPR